MKIPPPYSVTPQMQTLIAHIDALQLALRDKDSTPQMFENIQRKSLLKSSLYSARIEGNLLTESTLPFSPDDIKKKEVFNVFDVYKKFPDLIPEGSEIGIETIKTIHSCVLKDFDADAGKIRTEISAIFNQAGVVVYLTPPPTELSDLLQNLFTYINSYPEPFPLVRGCMAHLIFEKIHPFIDGNGRVGRLLISAVLRAKGYENHISIPFEEYLDNHRDEYYAVLDKGFREPNSYLIFMLEAYYEQILKMYEDVKNTDGLGVSQFLSPRQEELYYVIQDHKTVSFDFLRRRFLKVPPRTLRYDLKKLIDAEVITKVGKTKGVWYKSRS